MPAPSNPQLPRRLALPGIALAATLAGAIFVHRYNPDHWPLLAISLMHALHGLGFALLALAVYLVLRFRHRSTSNYYVAAAITMAIGILSEIAQIPGPRDAQFSDLAVDALGIFGALGVTAAFDRSVRSLFRMPAKIILPAIACVALAIACLPSLWVSYVLIEQYRAFPQLLTFEHAWENAAFRQTRSQRPTLVPTPNPWPAEGKTVALAKERGRWGIFLSFHPMPDWQGYSVLSFVAASTRGDVAMDIGIRDMPQDEERYGVRYYKSVRIGEQPRRITVTFDEILANPKARSFDFSQVEAVVLSAATPGQASEVFLDDFRLER